MSKHTPGPWSLPHFARDDISCNCMYVLAEPYCGSICTISLDNGKSISEGGNDCPQYEEAAANARLIAAAPDLLEALKRCKFDSLNMSLADLDFCREAYLKATGDDLP